MAPRASTLRVALTGMAIAAAIAVAVSACPSMEEQALREAAKRQVEWELADMLGEARAVRWEDPVGQPIDFVVEGVTERGGVIYERSSGRSGGTVHAAFLRPVETGGGWMTWSGDVRVCVRFESEGISAVHAEITYRFARCGRSAPVPTTQPPVGR
jgi:hypothetical protein